jgi:hypothetical protein
MDSIDLEVLKTASGHASQLVTVVKTSESSPRPPHAVALAA